MKILCIGEALIDLICTDRGSALKDGEHFLKKAGGAPANVAAAIAAMGGAVDLAAKVGVDPFGTHLVEVMQSFGVGTEWMIRDERSFTTFAFVSLMESGERDFYFNRGADGQLSTDDLRSLDLTAYGNVHFGSATGFLPGPLQEAYAALLQQCQLQDIFISFDPNYRQLLFQNNTQSFIDQSWPFLLACHFFKVSDEEAMLLTGAPTVQEAAADFGLKTGAVFAITLGKEGTLLGVGGNSFVVPSIEVKAVDTTGAGDAFTGAVLYQLRDKSLTEILALGEEAWQAIVFNANKAGARTCLHMGAMEAFKQFNSTILQD